MGLGSGEICPQIGQTPHSTGEVPGPGWVSVGTKIWVWVLSGDAQDSKLCNSPLSNSPSLAWKQGYPHCAVLSWYHCFVTEVGRPRPVILRDVPWSRPAIFLPMGKRSQNSVTNLLTRLLQDSPQPQKTSPQQCCRVPKVTGSAPKSGEGGRHLASLPQQ